MISIKKGPKKTSNQLLGGCACDCGTQGDPADVQHIGLMYGGCGCSCTPVLSEWNSEGTFVEAI